MCHYTRLGLVGITIDVNNKFASQDQAWVIQRNHNPQSYREYITVKKNSNLAQN